MTEATSKVQAANTIALCGGKNYQWYLVDLKKILKEQNILQEWLNDVTSLELREDLCTVQCKNATKGVDEPQPVEANRQTNYYQPLKTTQEESLCTQK